MLAASAMLAAPAALAQQNEQQPRPAQGPIGPPQLRDFQLTPRERIVTQPRPAPAPQQPQATPAPATQAPATERQTGPGPARVTAPVQRAPVRPGSPVPQSTAPRATAPTPLPPVADVPAAIAPFPAPVSEAPAPAQNAAPTEGVPASGTGLPLWLLLLGGLGLGVVGYVIVTRRRGRRALTLPAPEAAAAETPRAPRADPVPRAWLEVELRPERTTADPAESKVEFEMTIRNNGGSTARNIQLQAKLICSTPDQDKEIAAFQRKKPGEHRTLSIPDLPAGGELKLKGQVDAKQDEMKAMRVEQRLLFVPLVAVNAFYDWGTVRTGQTSRSFLIGRERSDSPAKMAPFRLDLGPRVYRTLGQRPYRVERRV